MNIGIVRAYGENRRKLLAITKLTIKMFSSMVNHSWFSKYKYLKFRHRVKMPGVVGASPYLVFSCHPIVFPSPQPTAQHCRALIAIAQ